MKLPFLTRSPKTSPASPAADSACPAPVRVSHVRRASSRNEYEVLRRAHEQGKRIAIERKGEDDQLRANQRAELLAMIRAAFRCSPLPRALVLQRRLNVVGSVGGKLQLTTQDADFNRAAAAYFKRWSRSCEYTDGKPLNELLQLILSALDTGGDCVVVHDAWDAAGGVLCGSNKVRIFESDEIGNLPEDEFKSRYPDHVQRAGKIYNAAGRFVGVTVSTSCRGQSTFPADKALTFLRDPDAPAESCPWVYLQESWRANQGRGVSTFAASVDLIGDFGDILSSEASAAKMNATMYGAYIREKEGREDGLDLDDYRFEEDTDAATAAAGPTMAAVGGTVTPADPNSSDTLPEGTEVFPDVIARSRGLGFDCLPDGYKFQQYDSKRPNEKIADFLLLLSGQVAATLGLNRTYATLEPQSSYTAFRGAQLLARPSFTAAQKMLERSVCDWIAARIL